MTEGRLRDAVCSFDGSLDDVRREHAWRGIECALTSQRPAAPVHRLRFVAVFAIAATAIVALAFGWHARTADDAAVPALAPTVLAASAGQRTVYDRGGVVLTLVGPGAATVTEGDPRGLHVRVVHGTLIADRSDGAPTVIVDAAGNTTTTRDARFAVRVQPGLVVFGAGDQARAMIERHEHAPPPRPATKPAPVPRRIDVTPSTTPTSPRANEPSTLSEPSLDARELYMRAEAAMRVKDPTAARQLLQRLVSEHPEDSLVDAARYDLALIALGNGDSKTALDYTRQIIDGRDPILRAAATRLRARIERGGD